jgi:hypothetical protein
MTMGRTSPMSCALSLFLAIGALACVAAEDADLDAGSAAQLARGIEPLAPPPLELLEPADGATVPAQPVFRWRPRAPAVIQICLDPACALVDAELTGRAGRATAAEPLGTGDFYWRAARLHPQERRRWSTIRRFSVTAGDCASPAAPAWEGVATRSSGYGGTDDVVATVRWDLVESVACVDRYEPSGTAQYTYAIPGALCPQTLDPASASIEPGDGSLTIDRTTSPPTFHGSASTSWAVTWTCDLEEEGLQTATFSGGGAWFDAAGPVAHGVVAGDVTVDVPGCHLNQFSYCFYTWHFEPVE